MVKLDLIEAKLLSIFKIEQKIPLKIDFIALCVKFQPPNKGKFKEKRF